MSVDIDLGKHTQPGSTVTDGYKDLDGLLSTIAPGLHSQIQVRTTFLSCACLNSLGFMDTNVLPCASLGGGSSWGTLPDLLHVSLHAHGSEAGPLTKRGIVTEMLIT